MKYVDNLTPRDRELAAAKLAGFFPAEIYDIHAHPYHPGHFPPGEWQFLAGMGALGCAEHRAALQRYMAVSKIHGLYFGLPRATADRPAMNAWVADEVREHGTPLSRALLVASPMDDRAQVAAALQHGTEITPRQKFPCRDQKGVDVVNVSHRRLAAGLAASPEKLIEPLEGLRKRLFDQHMQAPLQGAHRHRNVQMRRGADYDRIKAALRQRLFPIAAGRHLVSLAHFFQQGRVGVAGGYLRPPGALEAAQMPFADTAAADDQHRMLRH
ncbi:MAG: hypothetical protein HY736_24580 [Verrucomicrobia bacterium]|nr:hypothetical protein [Verrucomicrobiota bacterium]